MAKQVQVLLLENISSMGSAGDIVSVSEGYARNFLFPQGKAALATSGIQSKYKEREISKAKADQKELEKMQEQADKLEGTELTMHAQAKEGDELYGSIGKKEIAAALNEQVEIDIKPKNILLEQPIKKLGNYPTIIQLSPDVEAKVVVAVLQEENKGE